MNFLKLKFNISYLKWVLFCGLLLGNLLLFAPNDDMLFIIVYEISLNLLAITSFILLSIFPRFYYIFNDKGISFQNWKGKENIFIPYESILEMAYIYVLGIYPDGLEIVWEDNYDTRNFTLSISRKQVKKVYDNVPPMKEKTDYLIKQQGGG